MRVSKKHFCLHGLLLATILLLIFDEVSSDAEVSHQTPSKVTMTNRVIKNGHQFIGRTSLGSLISNELEGLVMCPSYISSELAK
jgi:hypothetical protein